MTKFLRFVGNATWALAFGLSILLAFAHHDYKLDISLGVSVLSLVLSALGLLLARHCRREGDFVAARIGVIVWMAGVLSFSVTEFGFWAASFKERHAQYVQIKAAKERQEGLKDMAWHALQTGETRATSAEIEARIRAAEQADAWQATKQCANATLPASRQFCKEYFELRAALAKAGKLEAIEASFLAEKPKADQQLANRVFAAADLIAENTSLDERQASAVVILIVALVLMLARDLLPIAANPLGRRKPQEAAKAPEATSAAPVVASPAPRPRVDALTKIAGVSAGETIDTNDPAKVLAHLLETDWPKDAQADKDIGLLIGANSPNFDPDGPGTPMSPASDIEQMPSEGDIEPAAEKVIHAENRFKDLNPKSEWKIKRSQADTKDFVRECLDTDQDALRAMKTAIKERRALDKHVGGRLASLPDVYDIYTTWCASGHLAPKGQKAFSGELWSHLGLPKGTRKMKGVKGIRAASGLRFPVYAKQAERRYATA